MRKRTTPQRTRHRFAVCLDDSDGPEWLRRHHVYRVLTDYYSERDGLIRLSDPFGEEDDVFDADRFLLGEEGTRSNMRGANRIMAAALEAEARRQARGEIHRLGKTYAVTLKRISEVTTRWDDVLPYALTFWENWVEAAQRNWRKCGNMTAADWPRLARRLARDLRRGRLTCDGEIFELFEEPQLLESPEPKPRPSWLRGVYSGRRRSTRRLEA